MSTEPSPVHDPEPESKTTHLDFNSDASTVEPAESNDPTSPTQKRHEHEKPSFDTNSKASTLLLTESDHPPHGLNAVNQLPSLPDTKEFVEYCARIPGLNIVLENCVKEIVPKLYNDLKEQNETLERQARRNSELGKRVKELRKQKETLERQAEINSKLGEQVEGLKKQNEVLGKQVKGLKERNETRGKQVEELQGRNKKLKKEVEQLQERNKELKEEVEQLSRLSNQSIIAEVEELDKMLKECRMLEQSFESRSPWGEKKPGSGKEFLGDIKKKRDQIASLFKARREQEFQLSEGKADFDELRIKADVLDELAKQSLKRESESNTYSRGQYRSSILG